MCRTNWIDNVSAWSGADIVNYHIEIDITSHLSASITMSSLSRPWSDSDWATVSEANIWWNTINRTHRTIKTPDITSPLMIDLCFIWSQKINVYIHQSIIIIMSPSCCKYEHIYHIYLYFSTQSPHLHHCATVGLCQRNLHCLISILRGLGISKYFFVTNAITCIFIILTSVRLLLCVINDKTRALQLYIFSLSPNHGIVVQHLECCLCCQHWQQTSLRETAHHITYVSSYGISATDRCCSVLNLRKSISSSRDKNYVHTKMN